VDLLLFHSAHRILLGGRSSFRSDRRDRRHSYIGRISDPHHVGQVVHRHRRGILSGRALLSLVP
jgi:hypothetical protein